MTKTITIRKNSTMQRGAEYLNRAEFLAFADALMVSYRLGPCVALKRCSSTAFENMSSDESKWCGFLDQLSWLCDSKPGGKSIASISIHPTELDHIFLIATNADQDVLNKIKRQLETILRIITKPFHDHDHDWARVQFDLLQESLTYSSRRVEFYAHRLKSLTSEFQKSRSEPSKSNQSNATQDEVLGDYLTTMVLSTSDHKLLCQQAYEFRGSSYQAIVRDKIAQHPGASLWRGLRHYLGRLASWHIASQVVCEMVQTNSHVFRNHSVKKVSAPSLDAISTFTFDSDVEATVARLFHDSDSDKQKILSHLNLSKKSSGMSSQESNSSAQPKGPNIHAETLMLNHIYRKSLPFAFDIRYIGCSKRSCYFCDLFARFHPLKLKPRPRHGGTWIKWNFPCCMTSKAMILTVRRMTAQVLSDMPTRIMLKDNIGHYESTTGMTKSI